MELDTNNSLAGKRTCYSNHYIIYVMVDTYISGTGYPNYSSFSVKKKKIVLAYSNLHLNLIIIHTLCFCAGKSYRDIARLSSSSAPGTSVGAAVLVAFNDGSFEFFLLSGTSDLYVANKNVTVWRSLINCDHNYLLFECFFANTEEYHNSSNSNSY